MRRSKGVPRFTLKQLLIAVMVISVVMTAYLLHLQWRQRERIADVYGSQAVVQILQSCRRFEMCRVYSNDGINPAIEDWHIPADGLTANCGAAADRDAVRLRTLLSTPENFPRIVKDFCFHPTFLVRAQEREKRLDIYFCFESKQAAVVLDGQIVHWLTIDRVADELDSLFSTQCQGTAVRTTARIRANVGVPDESP